MSRPNYLTMYARTQIFPASQFLILSFCLSSWFKMVAAVIIASSHNSVQSKKEGQEAKAFYLGYCFFSLGRINSPGAAVCSCGSLAMDHMTHTYTNLQEKVIGSAWLASLNGELSLRLDPEPPDRN